jgi:Ser/Thr protein kinase RdoA (MazF antagonist)
VLAQQDVARYLLERGLLGPEALLDGDLVIRDASSRNRNYRVETRNGPCYLLKQGQSPEAAATVAHEAMVYQRLTQGDQELTAYLPGFYGYDGSEGVLVLELVRDATDMRTLHLNTGRFSAAPAATLGSALGVLHRTTRVAEPRPTTAPWALWIHRPDARLFRDVSAAGLELVKIIQSAPGFPEVLDRLRGDWVQAVLVHGDVKWDNCLLSSDGETLKLIDWESAAPGDPRWDIGSALSHYLSFWIFSIPITGAVPPERFPELAAYPLDAMKPALAACWIAYVDASGVDAAHADGLMLRAVEAAGVRLIQTAFEAAQMTQQLTSALVLHLQLAFNILQQPEAAASQLLGLRRIRSHAV